MERLEGKILMNFGAIQDFVIIIIIIVNIQVYFST